MTAPKPTSDAEFAWPGADQPGELRFAHQPSQQVADAIITTLVPHLPFNPTDAALHSLAPSSTPAGRYHLASSSGDFFVRVSARWGEPALEKALLDYLVENHVPANPILLAGIALEWEGIAYRLDVRPLIQGRHFTGDDADLPRLGAALAACHRTLRTFPQAESIRHTAEIRCHKHETIRQRLAAALNDELSALFGEQVEWAQANRDWLAEMARSYQPRFDTQPGAQPLHGQVHPGNILFRRDDNAAVLLDLEEAVQVYAPPVYDLAYAVQRFCMRDNPRPEVLRGRIALIFSTYGQPIPDLFAMMRQLAWFSMAVILDLRARGIATSLPELDKFVRLEQQARSYQTG